MALELYDCFFAYSFPFVVLPSHKIFKIPDVTKTFLSFLVEKKINILSQFLHKKAF